MAPRKPRRASPKTPSLAQYKRLLTVTRRLAEMVEQLADEAADARDERRIQLQRIAQLQAELDTIKKAWEQMKGNS